MSRSGYVDDLDYLDLGRWRGQVASAMRGRRGQVLLRDLVAALDAMPEKLLIAEDLVDADGDVCALGAVGKARGIDMSTLDPEDSGAVAVTFDIADQLAREIVYQNDEGGMRGETPEQRWQRMRTWAACHIREDAEC